VGLQVNVTLPLGQQISTVLLPKLGYSSVTIVESHGTVWQNGQFVPGVDGVAGGTDLGSAVQLQVLSGEYQFTVSNAATRWPIDSVLKRADIDDTLLLQCPHAEQRITFVWFASFGNPSLESDTGKYSYGSCHSGSSKAVLERECVGKSRCAVPVTNKMFGEVHCKHEQLVAHVQCA